MKALDRLLQRWRISKARPYVANGARLLDIGCADGELFRRIPEVGDGIGVDPDLAAEATPRANAVFVQGMFPRDLPDRRPFDVITLLAVLEHVPPAAQRELALDCARHLKPGGYLVVTVPSPFVDRILAVLKVLRLIHGMALEQHYGYDPSATATLFTVEGLVLVKAKRFQLGLNNLFVFQKSSAVESSASPAKTASNTSSRLATSISN